MVCIYCQSETQVTNSRPQKRTNSVWRRRHCLNCHTVFSTEEHVDMTKSIVVRKAPEQLEAFQRDVLFISVYVSVRHRKSALTDATGLTDTITSKILILQRNGIVETADIIRCTYDTLRLFDEAAAVHYQAYHPLVNY